VKYVSVRDGGGGQATLTVGVRGLEPSAWIMMAFEHEV
jgi:hypothetical protein